MPKSNENYKKINNLVAFGGPEQIVYENSKVFLEGYSFPPNQKLIWNQIYGPKVELEYKTQKIKMQRYY